MKASTLESYNKLKKRIYLIIGNKNLGDITSDDVQNFIDKLSNSKRHDKKNKLRDEKISTVTIKLQVFLISSVYKYAINNKIVNFNTTKDVTFPKSDTIK